jgi:S1-C subfamily serine protease
MRSPITRNLLTGVAFAGLLAAPLAFLAAKPAAHSYLGIGAEAKAKEGGQTGVTLREVSPDGPAGKAGLKTNDCIVKAGDKDVKTFEDLKQMLASHKPGDKLALKVLRDGKEQTFTVTLGEMPEHLGVVTPAAPKSRVYLGVHSQALTPQLKEFLGVPADKGALVTLVLPGSPAATAGLQEEDIITHVGSSAVVTPEELRDAVQKAGAGKEVTLKVVRNKKEIELKAKLQDAPAGVELGAGFPELPEGFMHGKLRPFFQDMEKGPELEKKVQELEKRVRELEKKLATKGQPDHVKR